MINKDEAGVKSWFEERSWLERWSVLPHESVDVRLFWSAYFNRPDLWRQAFKFLSNTDLAGLPPGTYEIDGKNLFVTVQEYFTIHDRDARYEAHRRYADIQYVVRGCEQIGVLPIEMTSELVPYDPERDITFLHADSDVYHLATASHFFVFFPTDAHKPCVAKGTPKPVKKIVLKVRL